jgi:hypothetical protein
VSGLIGSARGGASIGTAKEATGGAGGTGGGIAEITSTDGSVVVTDPTGPITNLEVLGGGFLGTREMVLKNEAATLLRTQFLAPMEWFFSSALLDVQPGGAGTAEMIVDATGNNLGMGGCVLLSTNGGAPGTVFLQAPPAISNRAPSWNPQDVSVLFYHCAIFGQVTPPDGGTQSWIGSDSLHAGVLPLASQEFYALQIGDDATLTGYVLSTVPIDDKLHLFRWWYDGTHLWFRVDAETPIPFPLGSVFPIGSGAGISFPLCEVTTLGDSTEVVQAMLAYAGWFVAAPGMVSI